MKDLANYTIQGLLATTHQRIWLNITLRIKMVTGLLVWQIKECIGGGLRGVVGVVHDAE